MRYKPANWLRYPEGTVARTRANGFTKMHVYCVGPEPGPRCWHKAALRLDDLPDLSWCEIGARLRCTECGSLGYVSMQVDWGEVIDFSKPSGH
jgi:hypothetical protein